MRKRAASRTAGAGGGAPGSAAAEVLTIHEVAAYLRIPLSTIYRLAERGAIPGHKVGRQWRFHKPVLDDWFRRRAATPRSTILVIDDEEATRQFLASVLQTDRRQILTAASGAEALEVVQHTDVDLVLLDLVMPGMSGVETFRRLVELRPGLPVVIVTGYPESTLMSHALGIGPFTVLTKPIDVNHLEKVIAQIAGT